MRGQLSWKAHVAVRAYKRHLDPVWHLFPGPHLVVETDCSAMKHVAVIVQRRMKSLPIDRVRPFSNPISIASHD